MSGMMRTGSRSVAIPTLAWFALSLLGCVVLLGLAAQAGLVVGMDRAIIDLLSPLRQAPAIWLALTRLGDFWPRILLCAGGMALLWFRGHRRSAGFLPLAALIETTANSGLKLAFARARPDILEHLDRVTSLSYPSGHSAHNMALWLLIAVLMAPARAQFAITVAMVPPVAIGISRIVLGVHWPTDVLGGLMSGAGFALLMLSVHRKLGTNPVTGTSSRSRRHPSRTGGIDQ